jgi:hypothetical protein
VLWRTEAVGAPALAFIPRALKGTSWLLLIQNGVALEPIELLEDFGCLVVLEAEGVAVDISGFRARDSDQLNAMIRSAYSHLLELVRQAIARYERLLEGKHQPNTPSRRAFSQPAFSIWKHFELELVYPLQQLLEDLNPARLFDQLGHPETHGQQIQRLLGLRQALTPLAM